MLRPVGQAILLEFVANGNKLNRKSRSGNQKVAAPGLGLFEAERSEHPSRPAPCQAEGAGSARAQRSGRLR